MTHLLLVDDEPNILASLRRCLLSKDEFQDQLPSYQITLHTSPAAALAEAEHQAFDLVLSDYRMPGMDGVTFLNELRIIQPDIISIILSGMTDLQGLLRAINEAHIHRFIPKPWEEYELRAAIGGALAVRSLQLENQRLADELRKQNNQAHLQRLELERLERECPGITQVKFAADGSIVFEGDME